MPLSKEYILTLLKTPKIGQVSAKSINSKADYKISSINELYDLIVEARRTNAKIPLPQLAELHDANVYAQRILESSEYKGVSVISVNETNYPIKLMRLNDYPIIAYVKGSISSLNAQLTAAVIGTREPSPFGLKVGRRVSSILAKNGYTIISGLALGCDTAGHLGALDALAPTVAVLASGVDIIYPKENQYLSDKIIDCGGALFSEYEVGHRPQRAAFVERDRLQTGLSDGIVVVETDIQGGTMHAVNHAKKLNVPIGCISNHPDNLKDFPKIRGNKMLIETGAYPLGSSEEIFTFIKKMNPKVTEFINDEKVAKDSVPTKFEYNISPIGENQKQVQNNTEKPAEENLKTAETTIVQENKQLSEPSAKMSVDDPVMRSLDELKLLVVRLLEEQNSNRTMLNSIITLLDSKEKGSQVKEKSRKATKNQPELYEPGSNI